MRLVVIALLLAAQQAPAEERVVLDNGLVVVAKRAAHQDLVAVVLSYRAGVLREPADRHGLSHLVEHLVVRGATTSWKQGEAEKAQIEAGPFHRAFMDANAETLHDFVYFYSVCPSARLDQALRIEAERMRSCTFTRELLDVERGRALDEVKSVAASPMAAAWNESQRLAYRALAYGRPKVGSAEGMKAVTVEEAKAFYDAWYRPNNATLLIYGNVDPAEAIAAARERFGGLEKADLPAIEQPKESGGTGARSTIDGEPRQVLMSWPSPFPDAADRPALVVGIYALLGRRGAIHGLTSQVFLFDDVFRAGRSTVTLSTLLKPDADPAAVEKAAHDWIAGLAAKDLEPKALEQARLRLKNDFGGNDTFQLGFVPKKDVERYAQALVQVAINRARREAVPEGRIEALLEASAEVSAEDVRKAVATWLAPERANVVIVEKR